MSQGRSSHLEKSVPNEFGVTGRLVYHDLIPTRHTPQSPLHTLYSTLYIPHFPIHIAHTSTLYTCTLYTAHPQFTPYTLHYDAPGAGCCMAWRDTQVTLHILTDLDTV